MPRSVLHISFSQSGGAGAVAEILADARKARGLPTKHSFSIEENLRVEPWSAPRHVGAAVIDDALIRKPNFHAPISLARDTLSSNLGDDLNVWDVLHLHNVNGVFRLANLAKRFPRKRIVWTLHDMNPVTGSCHYNLGCPGYITDCSSCPAVRVPFKRRVRTSLSQKKTALAQLSNFAVVAPSKWLADCASESSAMRHLPIHVIPNPIRSVFCAIPEKVADRERFTFTIVAQNLSDRVKNVGMAVEEFRNLKEAYPHISLALVGGNGEEFHGKGITRLGSLSTKKVAEILGETSSLIVPSLAENAPLVIAEAAARGTASIVKSVGGMPDMVSVLRAGTTFSNRADLSEAMAMVAKGQIHASLESRTKLSKRAIMLFSPESVSQQYDSLYSL